MRIAREGTSTSAGMAVMWVVVVSSETEVPVSSGGFKIPTAVRHRFWSRAEGEVQTQARLRGDAGIDDIRMADFAEWVMSDAQSHKVRSDGPGGLRRQHARSERSTTAMGPCSMHRTRRNQTTRCPLTEEELK